jgi:hypothetical protein
MDTKLLAQLERLKHNDTSTRQKLLAEGKL